MNEYSTVDSEIDFGGEVEELMIKVDKLTNENELLRKMMREKEHESSQKLAELKMENEKLTGISSSLEELVRIYQENTPCDSKAQIADLEEKVANLENNLFLSEQSELNLKRQNQNLNMEIKNLNLEINKLSINSKKEGSLISANQYGDNFENLDAETKNLIADLMNEIEDLKKEKNEISEKALNLLTEKEVEVMELKEQIEELKKHYTIETRKLQDQNRELKYEIEDKHNNFNDNESINSEEAKILLEKYRDLQDEFEEFKRIANEKEYTHNFKIENLQKEIEFVENTYKQSIQDLESEISMLHSREEKYLYENESRANSDNEMLIMEIDQLQNHIRNLEEIKEKLEFRSKDQISQLNAQIKNLDLMCFDLRNQKTQLENDLKDSEVKLNKNIKEIQEKNKIEIGVKQKEINQLTERLETLSKDNENFKKDYESLKKNSEKKKIEILELNETMKKYKDTNDNERKKLEEKYFILEKKFESEKAVLQEQIKELNIKINSLKYQSMRRESELSVQLNTLSKMLAIDEKERDEDDADMYKEEINQLNDKITELNVRILLYEKQKSDNELIIKENQKFKADIKELKEMYEKQINQLQEKALDMSNELQNSRRRTSRASVKGELALTPQQMTMFMELQNTLNRMTGEQKFLQQKIDVLNKEIENLRVLRDNDVKYLKDELRAAEEQAINAKVSLATLAFEKDCEMIKYKKLCNKLKAKIIGKPIISPAKKK